MEHVPPQQRLRADDDTAEQPDVELLRDERRVPGERRAHGHGPDRELVPRQQVAGERQPEGEEQQDHADDPVELARRLVRARVEHARHVQRHAEHHQVGTPSVEVPDEVPQEHGRPDALHVGVGLPAADVGHRPVEEHQEDAGDREQDEQEERQAAQAERVGQLQPVALHLHRVEVVQHVVHRRERAVARRVLVALPEDGARPEDRLPDLGLPETVAELARRRGLQLHRVPPLAAATVILPPPATPGPRPSSASRRNRPAAAHSTACPSGTGPRRPSTGCRRCRPR